MLLKDAVSYEVVSKVVILLQIISSVFAHSLTDRRPSCFFLLATSYLLLNSYYLPIAYCLLLIAYCLLLLAYCILPFTYCLLLIAYCLLPIAYCLLLLLLTTSYFLPLLLHQQRLRHHLARYLIWIVLVLK